MLKIINKLPSKNAYIDSEKKFSKLLREGKMMNINIVSSDKRYIELNRLLNKNGYISHLAIPTKDKKCDILILPLRNELDDITLGKIFDNIDSDTLVFSGNEEKIKEFYNGKVIDYSKGEKFLQKNAYLTAEATISVYHAITNLSIKDKKALVLGYGRIGKYLCRIFSSLGAKMFVYARREETKREICIDGYTPEGLDFINESDLVINTVPHIIVGKEYTNCVSNKAVFIELASVPGGFEDKSKVYNGGGLPGKILPNSSAELIYDTIIPLFPKRERVE